jgi:DNA-binding CsgD family transcriptional regulator
MSIAEQEVVTEDAGRRRTARGQGNGNGAAQIGLALVPAPRVSSARPRRPGPGGLTRREVEVLRLVSSGMTNRAAARVLWVTSETVKFHLTNVYRKLGVCSRVEASAWAYENGVAERRDGRLDFSPR